MFGKKKKFDWASFNGWAEFDNGKRIYDNDVVAEVKKVLTKKEQKDVNCVVSATLSMFAEMSDKLGK